MLLNDRLAIEQRLVLLALWGVLGLCGCCPGVKASADAGQSNNDGGTSSGAVKYSSIQDEMFDRHCVTDCHESLNPAANLRLSKEKSYQQLFNQPSQQVTSQLRVFSGNPDKSYLIRKLEGGPEIVGDQMPRLAPPRPQKEIDRVRKWINEGAPND